MRFSQLFVRTLREAPREAKTAGKQYLLRAGFLAVTQDHTLCLLPLGRRTLDRILDAAGVSLEMMGGQAMGSPPATRDREALPAGDECTLLFSGVVPAPFLSVAASIIQSYKQLPLLVHWINYAPAAGGRLSDGWFDDLPASVLEGCSLQATEEEMRSIRHQLQHTFSGVLRRLGLDVLTVPQFMDSDEKSVGFSLIQAAETGDIHVLRCPNCGYMEDQRTARGQKKADGAGEVLPLQLVETPDCTTIAELAAFLNVDAAQTGKAIFLVGRTAEGDERGIIAIVRGDKELSHPKLCRLLELVGVRPASETEIRRWGAVPGYGSPIGTRGAEVVVDDLIPASPNLVVGANRAGYHQMNANYGRDYSARHVADITLTHAGDDCPECGHSLEVFSGVELAGFHHLPPSAVVANGISYLDAEGEARPIVAGWFWFYAHRILAQMAETLHDENGLTWPTETAPFDVYLMSIGKPDSTAGEQAGRICRQLQEAGIRVLFDDRNERAGVKFNDADLIGVPLRVVVGDRGLSQGVVEVKPRAGRDVVQVPLGELVPYVQRNLAG